MHGDQLFTKAGLNFLVVFTLTKAYKYVSGGSPPFVSIQDANNFTVTADNPFDTDIYAPSDFLLIADQFDTVRKWTGIGNMTLLGGLTTVEPAPGQVAPVTSQGKIVRSFQGFIVLFAPQENGTVFPQRVRWSQYGVPETWKLNADGSGQAGSADLQDSSDFIVDAQPLNRSMAIYKERSIYLMTYVGLPQIFIFTAIITGLGLLSQRCIANLGDEHIFMGSDNFYIFNGVGVEAIGDKIKDQFFSELDPRYNGRCQAFVIEEEQEICFHYPSVAAANGLGNIDRMVVYNYATGAWCFRESPSSAWFYFSVVSTLQWNQIPLTTTWQTVSKRWNQKTSLANEPLSLFGTVSGVVENYGVGSDQDGTPFTSIVLTKFHDMREQGFAAYRKRVTKVKIMCSKSDGFQTPLKVRLAHVQNPGDTPSYEPPITVALTNANQAVYNFDASDIYHALEISNVGTSTASPWDCYSYQIFFTLEELAA